MAIFKLKKDSLYENWWRDYYEIEADSLEEAINIVLSGEVEPYDTENLIDALAEPVKIEILDEELNKIY
jgi:hypothetical protein